jgi:Ca2+-binding RTX toxin-like protein
MAEIFGTENGETLTGTEFADIIDGRGGNDTITAGGGDDRVFGADGDDVINFNVSTDGADSVDGGIGNDIVAINAAIAGQIRLSFTSGEVGNGSANDSNTMPNQDGGLAVRLQREDGSGALTGPSAASTTKA